MLTIPIFPGPAISSYAVEDRVQVADLDPSMIVDYVDDDSDSQPCPVCGDSDNEELLMICDGCDVAWHTYCVGLDAVPPGAWYCEHCEAQRSVGSLLADSSSRTSYASEGRGRRTRAQQRRMQSRNQINSFHWARVWQSVWDRLNLDLDFPFEDDAAADRLQQQLRREAANQREFRSWQQRFQNTERQGSGRLRDSALMDMEAPRPSRPRAPRAPTPEPESVEEMRAWNAFERAREIEHNPGAARKRKEPTVSPSPEPTEPERKLKRPRTRRPQELAALAMQNGESSRAASVQTSARINAENSSEPSFLQSLLREVEEASVPSHADSHGPHGQATNGTTEHYTPGPSSPSISPSASSHSSPRLSPVSTPPFVRGRPISPMQLTSPSRPSSPPFSPDISPFSPSNSITAHDGVESRQRRRVAPRPRPSRHNIPRRSARAGGVGGVSSSNEGSPTRPGLSYEVKSDIQKLVGRALKPHYRAKKVTKDDYTEINRTISRKLYDRVGDGETIEDQVKANLEQAANEEVRKAIAKLRPKKKGGGGENSDCDCDDDGDGNGNGSTLNGT